MSGQQPNSRDAHSVDPTAVQPVDSARSSDYDLHDGPEHTARSVTSGAAWPSVDAGPPSDDAEPRRRSRARQWITPLIVGVLAFGLGVVVSGGQVEEPPPPIDLDAEIGAALAEVEGERDVLATEVENLESERDGLAAGLEEVTAERDEALERVQVMEAEAEQVQGPADEGADLRQLRVLALTSVLEDNSEREGLCDAWEMMGNETTAAVINGELEDPDDRFPVDVVAEVFADVCS